MRWKFWLFAIRTFLRYALVSDDEMARRLEAIRAERLAFTKKDWAFVWACKQRGI